MIVLDENKINNNLCGLQTLWVRLQIYEWRCIGFASFYKVLHTYTDLVLATPFYVL